MTFDPQNYHRRSTRLPGYDYTSPAAYFVNLCAWRRECLFGEVVEEENRLSDLGCIIQQEWLKSKAIRQEIRLFDDEFVIKPNHVHAIVWIVETVGAHGVRPDNANPIENPAGRGVFQVNRGAYHAPLHRSPRSLLSFIASFKSSVTHRARSELSMTSIWQRNYYEHIIRGEHKWTQIQAYFAHNPAAWQSDPYHT